jgi:hypothetical protein
VDVPKQWENDPENLPGELTPDNSLSLLIIHSFKFEENNETS